MTVDVPVAGARLRDTRNGMTIPPALTLRTVLDALRHPHWWFDLFTTEPLSFASFDRWPGTVAELLDTMFDPTITFDDLAWIKAQWPGKFVVKGIQTLRGCAPRGGPGCRRDRVVQPRRPATGPGAGAFHLLPRVVAEFGSDAEVLVDTGVMSGADVVAAVALGARFTLSGGRTSTG